MKKNKQDLFSSENLLKQTKEGKLSWYIKATDYGELYATAHVGTLKGESSIIRIFYQTYTFPNGNTYYKIGETLYFAPQEDLEKIWEIILEDKGQGAIKRQTQKTTRNLRQEKNNKKRLDE